MKQKRVVMLIIIYYMHYALMFRQNINVYQAFKIVEIVYSDILHGDRQYGHLRSVLSHVFRQLEWNK